MAEGVIKKLNSFGNWISISSGFEAPNDGFVKVLVNPTQSGAYAQTVIGGTACAVSTGGYANTAVFPIAKGQTAILVSSLNATVTFEYRQS